VFKQALLLSATAINYLKRRRGKIYLPVPRQTAAEKAKLMIFA
jgi:hypothetical protein